MPSVALASDDKPPAAERRSISSAGGQLPRCRVPAEEREHLGPAALSGGMIVHGEVRLHPAVRYRAETYPAAHGWMKPDFPVYDHAAAERGWTEMLALFGRNLHRGN